MDRNGWMPIESANRVNRPAILLAGKGWERAEIGYWIDKTYLPPHWTYGIAGDKCIERQPTVWQPLPPPPNSEADHA